MVTITIARFVLFCCWWFLVGHFRAVMLRCLYAWLAASKCRNCAVGHQRTTKVPRLNNVLDFSVRTTSVFMHYRSFTVPPAYSNVSSYMHRIVVINIMFSGKIYNHSVHATWLKMFLWRVVWLYDIILLHTNTRLA